MSVCIDLQILTRRLRFRLERASGESMLIDRSGRSLKMEPLATVSSLERHLLKMVRFQCRSYHFHCFTVESCISENGKLLTAVVNVVQNPLTSFESHWLLTCDMLILFVHSSIQAV